MAAPQRQGGRIRCEFCDLFLGLIAATHAVGPVAAEPVFDFDRGTLAPSMKFRATLAIFHAVDEQGGVMCFTFPQLMIDSQPVE